jgi:hypothetical protein
MLYGMYQRGLTRVILFAKSQDGVVKWTPRTLFNAINSNYLTTAVRNDQATP